MASTKFCRAVASPAEASSRTIFVRDGLPWTPASQLRYRSAVSRTLAPMLSKICVASIPPLTNLLKNFIGILSLQSATITLQKLKASQEENLFCPNFRAQYVLLFLKLRI